MARHDELQLSDPILLIQFEGARIMKPCFLPYAGYIISLAFGVPPTGGRIFSFD